MAKVEATLLASGAPVDTTARPAFDALESHRIYLQLLGATNTAKVDYALATEWEKTHAADGAACKLLAGVVDRVKTRYAP